RPPPPQPLRDVHTANLRASAVTEPGEQSRSTDSDNCADLRCLLSVAEVWSDSRSQFTRGTPTSQHGPRTRNLRRNASPESAGSCSAEASALESLETALIGICRSSIAGIRNYSSE